MAAHVTALRRHGVEVDVVLATRWLTADRGLGVRRRWPRSRGATSRSTTERLGRPRRPSYERSRRQLDPAPLRPVGTRRSGRDTCQVADARGRRTHAPSTREAHQMTIRVGINGFGRIGRNFFRAAKQAGRRHRLRRRQRPRLGRRPWPTCSSTTRSSAGSTTTSRSADDGIKVDGDTIKVLAERDPKAAAVGRPRRRRRRRVDRLLHRPRQGGRPPRRRRPAA